MLILASLGLILNSFLAMNVGTEQSRATSDKLGYSRSAPRFDQFRVRTKEKGERQWLSLGRCDQADGRAFDRLVRNTARASGPLFAGHYSIVVCSCGTACGGIHIVDLWSGRIYYIWDISQDCYFDFNRYKDFLLFRIDSSLLILLSNRPRFHNGLGLYKGCAIRYYRWTGSRLVLIKETPTQKRVVRQSS